VKLHDYQRVAVGHLERNPHAGLFLDMGLGKTAVCLSTLTPEHLPALVVAPKRVAEQVWPSELRKWRPDLSLALAAGQPKVRAQALAANRDITVIGRDNLADVTGQYKTVILDELSGFKSRSSNRWKTARTLTTVPYVWGLTGTPSPNGYLDLWSQVYLLDRGERLGRTLTGYRDRYFKPGRQIASGQIVSWDIRPGAAEHINELLEDICLSMDSEGRIDLPPTTFNRVEVPLPPSARATYKEMKTQLLVDLQLVGGDIHTATNAAALSNRLSQISAGFLYPDNEGPTTAIHQEKVKAVQEIVDGTGSPVLVFYRYREERARLMAALPDVTPIEEAGSLDRWDRGEVRVLLAHPASAGHGLNLQHGGHTQVWTSLPWSLEEWEQGIKRQARQGQQHPVIIHMLISPRTVDEAIYARLVEKASVQKALMNHLESPL
jgi:hypothetical protein